MLFVSQLCEILQNEMRKRFFSTLYYKQPMKSEAQTINKPSQVYKKKSKEVMQSYPDGYYKEIVEFLTNSRYYL